MSIIVITGAAGLIGAESVRFFSTLGFRIVGIDNDLRKYFFGPEASTDGTRQRLEQTIDAYRHISADIRDEKAMEALFAEYGSDIIAVVHTAAQPSHDWAASDPRCDFSVNASGTLNLLEQTRRHCPKAAFVFTSTNKVYGDTPNRLPLIELNSRWEVADRHPFHARGIDETMSIDHSKHSLFGASKVAADILVQEYGRYFGMNTVCFRGGCLTGPGHAGAEQHGFLSYLVKCAVTHRPYTIYGYRGKQVRDNIHAGDLVNMFWHYIQNPRPGEVYNAGGGRERSCSIREAMQLCQEIIGRAMNFSYNPQHRSGDHIWYISDTSKFQRDYPHWHYQYSLWAILAEIFQVAWASFGPRKQSKAMVAAEHPISTNETVS